MPPASGRTTPRDRPEFREQYKRQIVKMVKKRKAEEMS